MPILRGNLRFQVEKFCRENPHYGTPEGAEGNSLQACQEFLLENGYDITECMALVERAKRNPDGTYEPIDRDYAIVCINQYRIDFTARAFRPQADFPLAWEM